jgi:hypothetical protein
LHEAAQRGLCFPDLSGRCVRTRRQQQQCRLIGLPSEAFVNSRQSGVGATGSDIEIGQRRQCSHRHRIELECRGECAPRLFTLPVCRVQQPEVYVERRHSGPLGDSGLRLFDRLAALSGIRERFDQYQPGREVVGAGGPCAFGALDRFAVAPLAHPHACDPEMRRRICGIEFQGVLERSNRLVVVA